MSSTPSSKPSKAKNIFNQLLAVPTGKASRSSSPLSHASINETGTTDLADGTPAVDNNQSEFSGGEGISALPFSSPSSQQSPPSSDTGTKTIDNLKLAWTGMETALRFLEKIADACPHLKIAVSGVIACLDFKEAVVGNREAYEKLAMELRNTAEVLTPYVPGLGAGSVNDRLAEIMKLIEKESKQVTQQRGRGMIKRIITANQDQKDVIQRYRQIESLFRQMHNILEHQSGEGIRKLVENALLNPVAEALYDSSFSTTVHRRGCTEDTRKKIMEDLKAWAENPDGAKIYWMNGMARTGKTTISYSFCKWLEENKQLGANYFCSRTSPLCRDVNTIIPSLAYQISQYFRPFGLLLYDILQNNTEVSKRIVETQFEKLLQEPLKVVGKSMPQNVVIVIDALDECDNGEAFKQFLNTLLKRAPGLPIKFFLTSRPEPLIRTTMSADDSHSVIHLHEIERSIVEADIQKYLAEALGSMSPPPSSNDVEQLAKRSGKLFIYAATVVRYIHPNNPRVNSKDRLRTVLGTVSQSTKQYDDLNKLYCSIISAAVDLDICEQQEADDILLTLRTVVCAKELMTVQTLASLLDLTEDRVRFALEPLRSVLHMQENAQTLIAPFHASFPDFLFDEHRSGKFHCEVISHNEALANHCFDLMKKELKFNICGLESSYMFDKDVPDLQSRIKKSISAALSYACQYWGEHFQRGKLTDQVTGQLLDFLTHRLLFWMEVLNLKQGIGLGGEILNRVLQKVTGDSRSEIQKQLADAEGFIRRFAAGSCKDSTPHIYISGLAFWTRTSSVYKNYYKHTQGLIDVKSSVVDQWQSPLIGVWPTGSMVNSVSFSPNGNHIVSGSDDQTIRVWDAHTGELVAGPFKGHTDSVNSVSFSPNGNHIVSGSHDHTIRVWDAHTGELVAGPFKGHTSWVTSVSFSPNGNHIVSGSHDQTIRVWEGHLKLFQETTLAHNFLSHSLLSDSLCQKLSIKNFTSHADGWVLADGAPFFWISSQFHTQLPSIGSTLVISSTGPSIIIDSPYLFIGKTWSQCYNS